MDELTERQAEILRLVRELTEVSGYPPTRAEIAERMGFRSVNAAEQHLRALEKKGAIDIEAGASRGIRVRDTRPGARLGKLLELPVVGRVAAGSPILAQEHIDQTYLVEASLFARRPDYLLKVRGMSMRDAGIMDGDLLAVQRAKDAKNGQIVVARLGDEVTVKRFRRTRNSIELIPENPDFETIVVPTSGSDIEFELEGLAVGLIRNNMLM